MIFDALLNAAYRVTPYGKRSELEGVFKHPPPASPTRSAPSTGPALGNLKQHGKGYTSITTTVNDNYQYDISHITPAFYHLNVYFTRCRFKSQLVN